MVGDTFKETATLSDKGVFYDFGVSPNLRSLYGVKKDELIYEVEFEIVEEKPARPKGHTNELMYFAYYDNGRYSLIQPTAEMFAMQFPWDIWEKQGSVKFYDSKGVVYFGIAVRIEPKKYTKLKQ